MKRTVKNAEKFGIRMFIFDHKQKKEVAMRFTVVVDEQELQESIEKLVAEKINATIEDHIGSWDITQVVKEWVASKYCRHCGTKLDTHELGIFDPQTGKREIEKICRPGDHEYEWLPWYKIGDKRCIKCGDIWHFRGDNP